MERPFVFNELQFAHADTTCTSEHHGYYRQISTGFQLMDTNRKLMAFVSCQNGEVFAVSASRTESGQVRYMFGTTSATEQFLNIQHMGYRASIETAESSVAEFKQKRATHG